LKRHLSLICAALSFASSACGGAQQVDTTAPDRTVTVYFLEDEHADPAGRDSYIAVERSVTARTTRELVLAALRALAAGPSSGERRSGMVRGPFQDAALIRGVEVDSSTVVIDFDSALAGLQALGTSAGGAAFNAPILRSLYSLPGIEHVEYRVNGSCQAFGELVDGTGCRQASRAQWEEFLRSPEEPEPLTADDSGVDGGDEESPCGLSQPACVEPPG